jgi:threonine/homoserine/homoserine lactone efflux protein
MDAWTIILMLGATAIWTAMVLAVVYATRAHRAARPLADLHAGPTGAQP